jgi:hypothetical protein
VLGRGSGLPVLARGSGLPVLRRGSGCAVLGRGSGLAVLARGSGLPVLGRGSGLAVLARGSGGAGLSGTIVATIRPGCCIRRAAIDICSAGSTGSGRSTVGSASRVPVCGVPSTVRGSSRRRPIHHRLIASVTSGCSSVHVSRTGCSARHSRTGTTCGDEDPVERLPVTNVLHSSLAMLSCGLALIVLIVVLALALSGRLTLCLWTPRVLPLCAGGLSDHQPGTKRENRKNTCHSFHLKTSTRCGLGVLASP